MGLEATTTIAGLVATSPLSGDGKSEGDDHIRLLKDVLQKTFAGSSGPLNRIQYKSTSYNLTLVDNYSTIVFSGGSNLVLSTAVTANLLGNGFSGLCLNFTGSTATFDPIGGEVVNGVASISIPTNWGLFYLSDGGNWYGMLVQLGFNVRSGGPIIGASDSQTTYDSAGVQSYSAAGNVIVSLHAGGASAISLFHTRGTNQLSLLDTAGAYAHFVPGTISIQGNGSAGGNFHANGTLTSGGNIAGNSITGTSAVIASAGYLASYLAGAPHTGIVYLSNSGSAYLHFDGSQYQLPNYNLTTGAAIFAGGSIFSGHSAYYYGTSTSIWTQWNGNSLQSSHRFYLPNGHDGTNGWAMANSDGRIGNWAVGPGYLAVTVDGTGYAVLLQASDAKLKENISVSGYNATNDISKMAFKAFDWKPGFMFKGHVPLGLVAQDLETIAPQYVITPEGENSTKALNTQALLTLALKGLQEANTRIAVLEARLAQLQP